MSTSRFMKCAFLLAALSVAACADGRAPEVAASAAALTGGTAVAELSDSGLVRITNNLGAHCSAALLTRRWAVTSATCFCDADLSMPSHVLVEMGDEQAHASAIVKHATADVALVRLDTLLPLAAPVSLWDATITGLNGKTLRCYGHADAPAYFDGSVASEPASLGTVSSTCGSGGQVTGVEVAVAAAVTLHAQDMGGPCFVTFAGQRLLAGVLAQVTGNPPLSAKMNALSDLNAWISQNTDIWTRAECDRDLPGAGFALDPTLTSGAPDANTLTLVADYAYNSPDQTLLDGIGTIVMQTGASALDVWTPIEPPVMDDYLRGVRVCEDHHNAPITRNYLMFSYFDQRHDQRLFWYDPVDARYVQREDTLSDVEFEDFDFVGITHTRQVSRVGIDLAAGLPLYVTLDGRLATSMYVDQSSQTHDQVDAYRDMFAPTDAPEADENVRPTLAADGTGQFLAGYLTVGGTFVTYAASTQCLADSNEVTPFCDGSLALWDLPTDGIRDFELAVTTEPETQYWLVTTTQRGDTSLWKLDPSTSHATFYGALGARSLSTASALEFAAAASAKDLFIAYTGASWAARVNPVGNCLGNTPNGF